MLAHASTLPSRAAVLRGTLADWTWAGWRVLVALVPVPLPDDVDGGGTGDADPSSGRGVDVVLLPGVYESWRFMAPLADALRAGGHRVHVVPSLGLHTVDVPVAAEVVRAHVDAEGLAGPLALVAHSKGGLVGKQLLVHHDDDGRFGCLVALNAPFSGSARARWLPLRALRVFVPGGQLLRDLDAARSVNARITSISSVLDAHVPGGGRLEGAANVVVDVVGHFRTLGDARVHAVVLDALRRCSG